MEAVKSATSGAVTMIVDDTTGSISFQSKDYGSTQK
jgi:flagellar hook-associated protein 2